MARAGDEIENPSSGQRLIFLKTAEETGGELLEVESVYTKPTPSRPPVAITLDTYSHVLPNMQDSAVAATEEVFS